MKKIKVGLFGFGRTGKIIASELIQDPEISLSWVIKKSSNVEKKVAGQILHLHMDYNGLIN